MSAVAEILTMPFFAVLDFVLAAPAPVVIAAACVVGVAILVVAA
jgi:hypothetical protein